VKLPLADLGTRIIPTGRIAISILQREFQRIVDAHYASVWSYVNVLTGNSPDSEDLTHQAFLLAFDRLACGDRTIQDMGKWLRGVVRNLVRAWWREKRRLPQDLADQIYELAEQACPNNVLQPLGLDRGLDNLWTPHVVADWSGCEPSCSNCGQICPTGAIRALPLEEKRVVRMGLAVVDLQTCLPHAGREACQLCVDECRLAGYDALEFLRVGTELDVFGEPIEGSGFLAPTVHAERCVGCGLCQTRCYQINVKSKRLLTASAVVVEAGAGKEDRLRSGSYLEQRRAEKQMQEAAQRKLREEEVGHGYLPDFLKEASP
jgi:formate hydrogenlyase subunit 6/NADH:ubiquinone oxidoreductase subunit I